MDFDQNGCATLSFYIDMQRVPTKCIHISVKDTSKLGVKQLLGSQEDSQRNKESGISRPMKGRRE